MSDLSDKIFGAASPPIAPPVRPKPTPKPIAKPPPKPKAPPPKPGFMEDPRVVGAEHATANVLGKIWQATPPGALLPWLAQTADTLTHGGSTRVIGGAMNVMDIPFGSLGATLSDVEGAFRARQKGEVVPPNETLQHRLARTFPATESFWSELGKKHLGKAISQYSLTSLPATVKRAKQFGYPVEKYFAHHPSQFGVAAGGAEAVNPAALATGEVAGLGLRGLGMGARMAGVPLTRFADIENAATNEAIRVGHPNPEAVGMHARVAARTVANSTADAKGLADRWIGHIFKGLDTAQKQLDFVDAVEGELTMPAPGSRAFARLTPADIKYRAMILGKANKWRLMTHALDKLQVGAGLDPARLWTSVNYFPRKGFSLNPLDSLDEDVQETLRTGRSAGGGPAYRKGTAGQNINRKFPTRVAALRSGVKMNPNWRPSQAAWEHFAQRFQNVKLEQGLQELEKSGLMEDRLTSTRTDYVPFTEVGKIRNLGAPTTRESVVHPAVTRLVSDVQPAVEARGVMTPIAKGVEVLPWVSRQAARFEVTNPIYHPFVNLLRNYMRGGNLGELAKAFLPGAKTNVAEEAGAVLPHVSAMPMGQRVLKFSERSTPMRTRLGQAAEHPFNLLSSEPVYKYFEPRMGSAYYKSLLAKGVSEDEAVERTRQMLGDPEGLTAVGRQLGKAFIFPSWVASMVKFWGKEIATHPELYMAPHRAVEARNLSRGLSPKNTDYYSMIPPIVGGKPKPGQPQQMITVPHPANRVLGAIGMGLDIAGGATDLPKVASKTFSFLNPAFATIGRAIQTGYSPAQEPGFGVLWDKDAPRAQQLKQFLSSAAGYYTPARTTVGTQSLGGLVGLGGYPQSVSGPVEKEMRTLERMVRSQGLGSVPAADFAKMLGVPPGDLTTSDKFTISLEAFRRAAVRLRGRGHTTAGDRLDSLADRLYNRFFPRFDRAKAKLGITQ